MPEPFVQPIDLPFIADDHEAAAELLAALFVSCASDDTEAAMDEHTGNLAGWLKGIRNDPLADAYRAVPKRLPDGAWQGKLGELMLPLGFFWCLNITEGEYPSGPFPEPELGHRPAAASGADFIYMALRTIGLKFSDEEYRDQFHVMVNHMRDECGDEDEATSLGEVHGESVTDVMPPAAAADRDAATPGQHDEVRQLVGDSMDNYDEADDANLTTVGKMLARAGILPPMIRSGEIVAPSPLVDRRRESLAAAAAGLKEAVSRFLEAQGSLRDVPALLSVLRPDGTSQLFEIMNGLRAISRASLRQSNARPHDLLLRVAMFEAVYQWVDITGELPEGPFDPDAEFCGPGNASGAEFVYRVLIHAGWDCTREEVLANLPAVNRQVAQLVFGEKE